MAAMAELISNSVQEMATNGQEPPVKYFSKGNDAGVLDAPVPLIEIPVVDLGLLTSPLTSAQELEKLKLALSSWGCFQVLRLTFLNSLLLLIIPCSTLDQCLFQYDLSIKDGQRNVVKAQDLIDTDQLD
jgi:hypothetical protein